MQTHDGQVSYRAESTTLSFFYRFIVFDIVLTFSDHCRNIVVFYRIIVFLHLEVFHHIAKHCRNIVVNIVVFLQKLCCFRITTNAVFYIDVTICSACPLSPFVITPHTPTRHTCNYIHGIIQHIPNTHIRMMTSENTMAIHRRD